MNKLLTPNDRSEMLDSLGVSGKDCAEVGVFDGWYSQEILKRNPRKLWLVDPWLQQSKQIYPDDQANVRPNEFEGLYQQVKDTLGKDERVEIVRGFSYFTAPKFQDESLDFVYVDAIHTFESCLCDALAWYHKVKPGGWLCGHDFTGRYTGVKTAVEAFCRLTNTQIGLMTLDQWASWGVQKPIAASITVDGAGK